MTAGVSSVNARLSHPAAINDSAASFALSGPYHAYVHLTWSLALGLTAFIPSAKALIWRISSGIGKAAILGGDFNNIINPKFVDDLKAVKIETKDFGKLSVYDLVVKRYDQMKKGVDQFDPFEGPIKDNKGVLKVKEGQRASKQDLLSIMYYVDNVEGNIPK